LQNQRNFQAPETQRAAMHPKPDFFPVPDFQVTPKLQSLWQPDSERHGRAPA
jgi:hypothetical protein